MIGTSKKGFVFNSQECRMTPRILSAIQLSQTNTDVTCLIKMPFWVLDYSMDDCGLCLAGRSSRKWLRRTPGCAYLYAPETPYREDTRNLDVPFESRYITFIGGENLGLDRFTGNGHGFAIIYDSESKLGDIMYKITSSPAGTEKSFWEAQSQFYSIIELIHRHAVKMKDSENSWGVRTREAKSEDELFLDKAGEFMKSNFFRRIELADIADFLNVSPSTLSHKYKSLTGKSPLDTLRSVRINEAKKLLIQGETLKIVAGKTGFYDEFHFSKTFRKQTGLPPKRFIRDIIME